MCPVVNHHYATSKSNSNSVKQPEDAKISHANHTCLQALANYEDLTLDRLNTLFSARTGLLGLGLTSVCTCEGHSHLWPEYSAGGFIRLREVRPEFSTP